MSSNKWSFTCKKCKRSYSWIGEPNNPIPPCPRCTRKTSLANDSLDLSEVQFDSENGCGYGGALEWCEEIITKAHEIQEGDYPSAAVDFASSIEETVDSIATTISDQQRVTDAQMTALRNMDHGLDKWIENRRY